MSRVSSRAAFSRSAQLRSCARGPCQLLHCSAQYLYADTDGARSAWGPRIPSTAGRPAHWHVSLLGHREGLCRLGRVHHLSRGVRSGRSHGQAGVLVQIPPRLHLGLVHQPSWPLSCSPARQPRLLRRASGSHMACCPTVGESFPIWPVLVSWGCLGTPMRVTDSKGCEHGHGATIRTVLCHLSRAGEVAMLLFLRLICFGSHWHQCVHFYRVLS